MSSPPAGNASGAPEPDWYPDPSIPGYIRYWNGTSWVPGSSRPEPREGEPTPMPPSGALSGPPPAPILPPARDGEREDPPVSAGASEPTPSPATGTAGPAGGAGGAGGAEPSASLPELRRRGEVSPAQPGTAQPWGADGPPNKDHGAEPRHTWGSDEDVSTSPVAAAGRVDPRGSFRLPPAEGSEPPAAPRQPAGPQQREPGSQEQSVARQPGEAGRQPEPESHDQTVGLRIADIPAAASRRPQGPDPTRQQPPPTPDGPDAPGGAPAPAAAGEAPSPPTPPVPPARPAAPPDPPSSTPPGSTPHAGQPATGQPAAGQGGYGYPRPGEQPGYGYPPAGPAVPGQDGAAGAAMPGPVAQPPVGPPPGGGYPQHDPSQQQPQPQPVQSADSPFVQPDMLTAMITPRRGDPAFASVGTAYPAALGRRLLARIVDALPPLAAAAAVGLPLLSKARDHIDAKIETIEHAGVTRDVWLIDGTTGGYLAMVLGVFLGVSLLCEALPTGLWGRSLGKSVCGLRVLDVERQDAPTWGAALIRWFTYSVLGLLLVGVVNVLWCLGDRPWRQCLHDKAAGTFVSGTRQTR